MAAGKRISSKIFFLSVFFFSQHNVHLWPIDLIQIPCIPNENEFWTKSVYEIYTYIHTNTRFGLSIRLNPLFSYEMH